MRHSMRVIPLVLVAGFTLGCSRGGASSAPEPNPGSSATDHLDTAKGEVQETAHKARHYAYAQKVEFVADMKNELAEIRAELDRLSATVDRAGGEAQAEAKANLESVQEKWAQAMERLEQAEDATESTWDEVQEGFGSAYDELQDSFGNARQWLSERIEP